MEYKTISSHKALAIIFFALFTVSTIGMILAFKTTQKQDLNISLMQEQLNEKENELSLKKTQQAITERQKNQIEDEKNDQETRKDLLAAYAKALASNLEDLDAILIKTDSNSLKMVNWFSEQCRFQDPELEVATQRYNDWKDTQHQTDIDYQVVKNKLDKQVTQLDTLTDIYNSVQNVPRGTSTD